MGAVSCIVVLGLSLLSNSCGFVAFLRSCFRRELIAASGLLFWAEPPEQRVHGCVPG